MTAVKTLAMGIVVGIVSPSLVWADSMSTSTNWVFFGGGSAYNRPIPRPSSNYNVTPVVPANVPASTPAVASISVPSVTAADHTSSIPVLSPTTAPVTPPSASHADAYINFGTSPAPESSTLTTGGAQPWYLSPAVEKVYGGNVPTAAQQASFTNMVLNDVKQTFNASGLNPTLTLDPNVAANHTMSVVSNTSYGPNPNAIGITDVGRSGFDFIDKLSYASTPDELATVLSKNISHELMHAFGVGSHPDSSGNYIDTGTATWSLLSNPNSTFSPAAVALINQTGFGVPGNGTGAQSVEGAQEITPVPEPATWALWTIGGLAGVILHRRRMARAA